MHGAAQRVDNCEQQLDFLREQWLDREQELIAVIQDEAVMSASPFFQSAGRGDIKFWGEDHGPTVVVWESLSESEQEHWSKKMGKSKDWVVWCRSRKKDEEQRTFEVDGKEIFSNRSKQAKPRVGEKTDTKGGKGQSVRWKACW